MSASLIRARSTRVRNPPQIYTPNRQNPDNNHKMSYKINTKKTLEKKIEATERSLCNIELKSGTLVITCSAASYEILKKSIYEYYDHSSTKTFRLHTKSSKPDNESVAGKMLIIEESLSIKHKNGGTNRQLYRINMFNTTSRIDVNGYWLQEFIQEDLHIICQCLEQYTDYKKLNNKIRETCQLSLPIAQRTTKDYTKTRNHNDTAHMISPNLQGWSPPTYTNDTIKSTTDAQPLSLHESTTPVQRINVISPPPDRKAIEYQALPTRNTITEIETFHEHCLSTELELDDREGMGAEYILNCQYCVTTIDTKSAIECKNCTNWHHAECVNIGCIPDDQYICSSCTALNKTIPYEETEHKQLMVENIAITNNDKEEQNITKSKTTESVEVPPHSHTTQATNATIANANRQEAKTKQKRTKKRDQLDYESVEMQLADCKAKIAMLEISNNDYKNTIYLLTAKLGIKEPMINRAEMYGNDHPQQSLFYKMGQIESQLTDRIDNLQKEMNHKLELKDLQIKHFMEMNELKCKFNILEVKKKLAPYNDNFCTRRENSKQDHPQPNQQYVAPPQAQIPTYVAFTNPVVPPPVHFQRASQYPQVINTNKGQTQVQPEYYTPYNNIGHPVNPIRTTIVPTDGEYRHRQAQNKGLPPLGTTYQHQRTGNQNCKNRSGEYRTLNLQWRNIQLAGNVNQTPNNTNSTTSNNKTSVEEVAQLDGKNHTYSLPADLQPPNATQDYQQNTQPMIETPTGTNTTKVPFLGDGRATTAAWQSKKYRQQS